LVKIASASKIIPNQRRYLITRVNHFINLKNLEGKDKAKKITNGDWGKDEYCRDKMPNCSERQSMLEAIVLFVTFALPNQTL
jgi:hypothetical protein